MYLISADNGLKLSPHFQMVSEGEKTVFICENNAVSPAEITWSRNRKAITADQDKGYKTDGSMLTILEASPDDHAHFQCSINGVYSLVSYLAVLPKKLGIFKILYQFIDCIIFNIFKNNPST